ncbi:hypothetical protein AB0N05_05125 [Nocardia sp. NPDC051030]|uniref:hypothetical protein n=1 Tax=Nocardia sp. NPDC051030 TaxID=3155162 RepID=UPI0034370B64
MQSIKSNTPRRMLTRVAAAGALILIPLGAIAIPASAEIPLEPDISEVAHPHHNDRDRDCDNDRDHRSNNQYRPWLQQNLPRGSFGSS